MRNFLQKTSDDENWLPIADMMTGLFVIFLFIAIVTIQNVSKIKAIILSHDNQIQAQRLIDIGNILSDFLKIQEIIYNALLKEFRDDLPDWKAEIDKEMLVFRFNEPDTLFKIGSVEIKPRYQHILTDFFPRYLRVLDPYKKYISEIRIEGHTSSEWMDADTQKEAFLQNMQLSQGRVQSVLEYVLNLPMASEQSGWIEEKISAVGQSSKFLRYDESGKENKGTSRRVEFRIYLNIADSIKW